MSERPLLVLHSMCTTDYTSTVTCRWFEMFLWPLTFTLCRRRPDALRGSVQPDSVQVVWGDGDHEHGNSRTFCPSWRAALLFKNKKKHTHWPLTCRPPPLGAGEAGGGTHRVDSAAFTPVHDSAARNRHVQPECEFIHVYVLCLYWLRLFDLFPHRSPHFNS